MEGPWTTKPTEWDYSYFGNLLNYNWEVGTGPGGAFQWHVVAAETDPTPPNIMMMTSDISLLHDDSYLNLVKHFNADPEDFDVQFSHAWYKLTSRDMGPVSRCMGDEVPPAQPFQYPLPPAPSKRDLPNFDAVKEDIVKVMSTPSDVVAMDDGTYGPLFVRLAWQCFNTFRATDYLGGCNGARLRHSPQREWYANNGLDLAMKLLEPVKMEYGDALSWADLIVLGGNSALEVAGKVRIPFTGGRVDETDEEAKANPYPEYLESRISGGSSDDSIKLIKDVMQVMGLSNR